MTLCTSALLRKLFRPVLCILGMAARPRRLEEFPINVSIEDWEYSLLRLYTSRDIESGPTNRIRLSSTYIVEFRRYKEHAHPEHEYLIAKIWVPEGYYRYLRIERTAHIPLNEASKSTLRSIPTTSLQASLAVMGELYVYDSVKSIEEWPTTSDQCLDRLQCPRGHIRLLDLAIVATLLHDNSPRYQILTRQCYWYSDMILGVLHREFPDMTALDRDASITLSYSYDDEKSQSSQDDTQKEDAQDDKAQDDKAQDDKDDVDISDMTSGTYMRVPIYTRPLDVIIMIQKAFQERRLAVQSLISEAEQAVTRREEHLRQLEIATEELEGQIAAVTDQLAAATGAGGQASMTSGLR
ncbi:hypothetical protein BDZ97DRAFT_1808122 [Flammula alnicola]|nr:hypothetical protein BDZ97DRAFT_1808122 [Flammula alnicola]